MTTLMEVTMQPDDLELMIREDMRFISLSADTFRQSSTAGMSDLGSVAQEIEQAIDDVRRQDRRSVYNLPGGAAVPV
jgi:hypothetical protein